MPVSKSINTQETLDPGAEKPDLCHALDDLRGGPNWGVEAVDAILLAGHTLGCSDVHVACLRDALVIRGRRHGALFPLATVRSEQRELIISRLKILARLPAFRKMEPQDGRMEFTSPDGETRLLRVSFLPTIHGENIVIRYPREDEAHVLSLDRLGMTDETFAAVCDLTRRQEGTVLLTGPSSSGKTTTMYAMLRMLNEQQGDRLNILTIEDPVERDLGFAGQVQINTAQGLTFESALRSSLRQDPNVLMLGEIRDTETARVTMQAGMSGHLVISTIHAGRASLVFSRLLSMGIDPYLVASAVGGAIAQRLARRLCAECGGSGCVECGLTGCSGRIGLFECCRVTEPLREMILASASPGQVATEAQRSQSTTLPAEARRAMKNGIVDRAEMEFIFAGEAETA